MKRIIKILSAILGITMVGAIAARIVNRKKDGELYVCD